MVKLSWFMLSQCCPCPASPFDQSIINIFVFRVQPSRFILAFAYKGIAVDALYTLLFHAVPWKCPRDSKGDGWDGRQGTWKICWWRQTRTVSLPVLAGGFNDIWTVSPCTWDRGSPWLWGDRMPVQDRRPKKKIIYTLRKSNMAGISPVSRYF